MHLWAYITLMIGLIQERIEIANKSAKCLRILVKKSPNLGWYFHHEVVNLKNSAELLTVWITALIKVLEKANKQRRP